MSRLVWGQFDQKRYETGIDRGVLYPSDGPGVPWNGLVNVEEAFSGGETTPYHFDGVKYVDVVSPKTFQATLSAFSAPLEFGPYLGERPVIPGFILTRQPRGRFGLSYRTMVNESDYKLHLVYNALASPNGKTHSTMNNSVSVEAQSWKIDAVPPMSDTYRPSAHFIVESNKIAKDALDSLEAILYGTDETPPRLISVEELMDIVGLWAPLMIMHDSATGLSPLVAGTGDLYKTKVAGIHRALPNTRLNKAPTDGLYRME